MQVMASKWKGYLAVHIWMLRSGEWVPLMNNFAWNQGNRWGRFTFQSKSSTFSNKRPHNCRSRLTTGSYVFASGIYWLEAWEWALQLCQLSFLLEFVRDILSKMLWWSRFYYGILFMAARLDEHQAWHRALGGSCVKERNSVGGRRI